MWPAGCEFDMLGWCFSGHFLGKASLEVFSSLFSATVLRKGSSKLLPEG